MGGAQPLAVTLNGGVVLAVEVDRSHIERRVKTRYCELITDSLDEALKLCEDARREGRALSVGLVGNCGDVLPEIVRRGVKVDVVTDQTSAHDPLNGYVPQGMTLAEAAELRQRGVDLSFTPVLDLDWGRSGVIGNRSFHGDLAVVAQLAGALIEGLRRAGMGACGKHFPGHGWAEADSHVAIPVDPRSLAELATDMEPYRRLKLDAVMPAHVIYPEVDTRSAGFSPVWIDLLRREIGFDGVIFSDDLSMEGASVAGDIVNRVSAAWTAGCDMLLVCNTPDAVGDELERWKPVFDAQRSARIARLLPQVELPDVRNDAHFLAGVRSANSLNT